VLAGRELHFHVGVALPADVPSLDEELLAQARASVGIGVGEALDLVSGRPILVLAS
jgi:hypothetical protein